MPSYHNPVIDGVKLRVRPLGLRRLLDFIPYSQGSRVKFRVEVRGRPENNPLGRIAIYEDLLLPEGSKKEPYPLLTAPDSQALGEKIPTHLDIEGSVIIDAGRQRYTINHPLEGSAIEIITFDAKKDATIFMFLTPTIIAILGTIVSVVLWFL